MVLQYYSSKDFIKHGLCRYNFLRIRLRPAFVAARANFMDFAAWLLHAWRLTSYIAIYPKKLSQKAMLFTNLGQARQAEIMEDNLLRGCCMTHPIKRARLCLPTCRQASCPLGAVGGMVGTAP